jgi:hypothetical protein
VRPADQSAAVAEKDHEHRASREVGQGDKRPVERRKCERRGLSAGNSGHYDGGAISRTD